MNVDSNIAHAKNKWYISKKNSPTWSHNFFSPSWMESSVHIPTIPMIPVTSSQTYWVYGHLMIKWNFISFWLWQRLHYLGLVKVLFWRMSQVGNFLFRIIHMKIQSLEGHLKFYISFHHQFDGSMTPCSIKAL